MRDRRPTPAGPITIKDIAVQLGVSHATVSRALNDSPLVSKQTKARVRELADTLGYVPDVAARVMRGEASNLVGFILPDVQNHFYSAIAKALAERVSAAGLQLVLSISEDDPERELRHVRELRQARARGIIITPVADMLSETASMLSQMRTVQLVRSHPAVHAEVVSADDQQATDLSTSHLISLGHRRIAYIGGGRETMDSGRKRLQGFRNAMSKIGDAEPIERQVSPHPESGYEESVALLRADRPPTALVISSSQLVLGALRAVREFDFKVPEDISLIGYDDPDWLRLWGEGVSTIELPIIEMARCAAERVSSPAASPNRQHIFAVRLIPRGSCRAIGCLSGKRPSPRTPGKQ